MLKPEWEPIPNKSYVGLLNLVTERHPDALWRIIKEWSNFRGTMGLYKDLDTGSFNAFFEKDGEIFYAIEWNAEAEEEDVLRMFNNIAVFAGCAFEMKFMKAADDQT